jgi:hypothetical protein
VANARAAPASALNSGAKCSPVDEVGEGLKISIGAFLDKKVLCPAGRKPEEGPANGGSRDYIIDRC